MRDGRSAVQSTVWQNGRMRPTILAAFIFAQLQPDAGLSESQRAPNPSVPNPSALPTSSAPTPAPVPSASTPAPDQPTGQQRLPPVTLPASATPQVPPGEAPIPWIQLLGLPLIGTIIGSLATWYFNERAAKRREQSARAERLLFENLAKRHAVYEKLYQDVSALEDYYTPFQGNLSEYDEQKEPADFAPLSALDTFRSQVGDGALWLDSLTRTECQKVVDAGSMGLTLALTIASRKHEVMRLLQEGASEEAVSNARDDLNVFASSVAGHVEKVLLQISSLKTVMRGALGLDSLDQEVAVLNARLNVASKKP